RRWGRHIDDRCGSRPAEGINQNCGGEHRGRSKAKPRGGSPESVEPSPPRRTLEDRVGNKSDALRNFFVTHREQGRFGKAQPVHFFAAGHAGFHVSVDLAALCVRQFVQKVIAEIEWRATHDTPRVFIGASSFLSSSRAVYSLDFTVETGHSRISAIS